MTKNEIINGICNHLEQDTRYKLFRNESSTDAVLSVSPLITFDISNTPKDSHHAPYFEVESLSQAREIINEVLEKENNYQVVPSFEEKFNAILATKQFDISKPLFISIYKEH